VTRVRSTRLATLRLTSVNALVAALVIAGCGGGDGIRATQPEAQRSSDASGDPAVSPAKCDVTTGRSPKLPRDVRALGREWFGHGDLYVATQPPAFREPPLPDGGIDIKVAWFRRVPGPLTVTARRLDGEGTAQVHTSSEGYPETGPLPTSAVVSGPGCWELTGKLATTTTVAIVRVKERPASGGEN
jgi:hypothetical protein